MRNAFLNRRFRRICAEVNAKREVGSCPVREESPEGRSLALRRERAAEDHARAFEPVRAARLPVSVSRSKGEPM